MRFYFVVSVLFDKVQEAFGGDSRVSYIAHGLMMVSGHEAGIAHFLLLLVGQSCLVKNLCRSLISASRKPSQMPNSSSSRSHACLGTLRPFSVVSKSFSSIGSVVSLH